MATLADQIRIEELKEDLAKREAQQQSSRVRLLKIEQERQMIETTMQTVDGVIDEVQEKLREAGVEE